MKAIKLTHGQVALVDDEDYADLNQFNWHAHAAPNTYYGRRILPQEEGKRIMLYMHHQIMGKPSTGLEIDHIDQNGLNNQRNNLRFITHRVNCHYNHKSTTSLYPGVSWDSNRKRWYTCIQINKKRKFLGYFTNELTAAQVYQTAFDRLEEQEIPVQLKTISVDTIASVLLAIEKAKMRASGN